LVLGGFRAVGYSVSIYRSGRLPSCAAGLAALNASGCNISAKKFHNLMLVRRHRPLIAALRQPLSFQTPEQAVRFSG
jgi:hypothetical protein